MRIDKRKIGDKGGMTQAEVASALGISQSTVSHLEKSALKKIRRHFERLRYFQEDAEEDMAHA